MLKFQTIVDDIKMDISIPYNSNHFSRMTKMVGRQITIDLEIDQPIERLISSLKMHFVNYKFINATTENIKKISEYIDQLHDVEIVNGNGRYKFSSGGTKYEIDDLNIPNIKKSKQLVIDMDKVSSDDIREIQVHRNYDEIFIRNIDTKNYKKLIESGMYFEKIFIQDTLEFPTSFISEFIHKIDDGVGIYMNYNKFYFDEEFAKAISGKKIYIEANIVDLDIQKYFEYNNNTTWHIFDITNHITYQH
jgi:hypothetical protein